MQAGHALAAAFAAIVMLAVLAVILSQKAQTGSVIQSASSGVGNLILAAVSPISGSTPNLTFPQQGNALANSQGNATTVTGA